MDAILGEFRALQRIDASPKWLDEIMDSTLFSALGAMAFLPTPKTHNARWDEQAARLSQMANKYPDDLCLIFEQSTLNPSEKTYLFRVVFQIGFHHDLALKARVLKIEALPSDIRNQYRGWQWDT